MNKYILIAMMALMGNAVSLAGVKVTSVNMVTNGGTGKIIVALDGRTNDLPDVKVNGKTIEVTLARADEFNSIGRNILGTQITAESENGKAIIRAILPYAVSSNSIEIGFKNNSIEVDFPRGKFVKDAKKTTEENEFSSKNSLKNNSTALSSQALAKKQDKKTDARIAKDSLNEDYLNKLIKEDKNDQNDNQLDDVSLKQASLDRTDQRKDSESNVTKTGKSSDGFSFAGYAIKFTLFMGVVLGLFYGVVQLLKKSVFKKGKLGFLSNSQLIEVLSTTYIAPKRSLMLVKAHKQIFLVSNSETGVSFISEITDTSGLIKEGEKFVTGTNFDLNLNSAEKAEELESHIKLKENIMESAPEAEAKGFSKIAVAKDIVKFSDELKKKAKKLKPIEFN